MRPSSARPIALLAIVASAIAWGAQAVRPPPAEAIPMFAKRTGASCELCHTVFPGMTQYGMMVMMSDFSPLPYHAAQNPGFVSFVVSEQYDSNPDGNPPPPKLFTDNLGILSGGYLGPNFTYYLEQHFVDGGFIGGTDQLWLSYNQLFKGTGDLQVGKFHTPFPFMPAHRITISPYATTANTVGTNNFNEDDSHWGVTFSDMQGPIMASVSALGGNQLICEPGCAQLGGSTTNHSLDFSMMSMNEVGLNYGLGIVYNGFSPPAMPGASVDRFDRSALYLQYIPPNAQRLEFQALGQLGWDSDPYGTGAGVHTQGFFTEAQYNFTHGNWAVLRWDSQNGDAPVSGLTLDLIHQFAPNFKFTLEGRTLTTGTTMGLGLEWAGPWSKHNVLASPVLGSMPGMNMPNMGSMSNMAGMPNMAGMNGQVAVTTPMSPLDQTLSHGDASAGEHLFQTNNCAACHGVGGSGGGIGPKLVGVAGSVSPNELYERIKHAMAPMPDFKLSDSDIANLVAYVVTLTPGHTVAAEIAKAHGAMQPGMSMSGMNMKGMEMSMGQPPPVYPVDQPAQDAGDFGYFTGVETGDPSAGRTLYARSCARCHGAGALGAGDAPNLTDMGAHFTPSHIAWHIRQHDAVTPPLQLTNKDVADLTAFLETLGLK